MLVSYLIGFMVTPMQKTHRYNHKDQSFMPATFLDTQ